MKKIVYAALLYLVLFTLISAMGFLHTLRKLDKRVLEIDNGFYYISLQHQSNPLDLPDDAETMRNFSDLHTTLSASNDRYQYFEINQQPLANVTLPNGFYTPMGELTADDLDVAQCVQVSQVVQSEFALSSYNGELLSDSAFIYHEGDSIPVVLGYDYANLYAIGDIFTAEYLYRTFAFEVTGFLKENCQITLSNELVALNQSILMPSFSFASAPQSEQDYVTQKIHAANRVSGKLKVSPESYGQVLEQVQTLTQSSPLGDFSVYASSSYKNWERVGVPLSLFYVLLPTIIAILLIASHLLLRKESRTSAGQIKPSRFALALAALLIITLFVSYFVFFAIIKTIGMQHINFWSLYCAIAIFIIEVAFILRLHTLKKSIIKYT